MPRVKVRNRGGRPSKFTTPAVVALTGALIDGGTAEAAARAAGIGPSTLYRWLAHARAGDPRFAALHDVISQARRAGEYGAAFADWSMRFLKAGF